MTTGIDAETITILLDTESRSGNRVIAQQGAANRPQDPVAVDQPAITTATDVPGVKRVNHLAIRTCQFIKHTLFKRIPPHPDIVIGVHRHMAGLFCIIQTLIDQDAFIEWAHVHGRYYGSQKAHILEILASGKDILLNIDIQGADAFRSQEKANPELAGKVHTVFIKPRSIEQIRERLQHRGSDDDAEIQRRLETAVEELKVADDFDHVIVSGSREADHAAIRRLYLSLKTPCNGPKSV